MQGIYRSLNNISARGKSIFTVALMLLSLATPAASVSAAPVASVIAGTGPDGQLINEIPATSAQFWNPTDVATTSDGTIYITDTSHQEVRSIDANGVIHAAFGDGISGCGTGSTQTRLWNPKSIVADTSDNLYVTTGCGQIVRFTPGNPVGTVVAGWFNSMGISNPVKASGAPALTSTIQPTGLSYDKATGDIYFVDGSTNRVLMLSGGLLNIVAGNGTTGFSGDGGPATAAQIFSASHTLFHNGTLYISDGSNCRVRTVDSAGIISTIIGDGRCNDMNTTGPGTAASISSPKGLAIDQNGILYVAVGPSGTVYAYNTGIKGIAPVLTLPGPIGGIRLENNGSLLVVGTANSTQQLFEITGLVTTPPSDGLQHGRVTNVSWSVSSTTRLWHMDVTVDVANVSCPAIVVVRVGTWKKMRTVCTLGQTAPSTVNFEWKVYSGKTSFTPQDSLPVTAYIDQSDAPQYGGEHTRLNVPAQPTIVAVGDSYLSGHNQTYDIPHCLATGAVNCSFTNDDYAFSWVTRMASKLNDHVPTAWQFAYDQQHLLAHSGATTSDIFDSGQVSDMQHLLSLHAGSWNVVAFDGGANNLGLSGALEAFYKTHNLDQNGLPVVAPLKPWGVTNRSDCPDIQKLYERLHGLKGEANQSEAIQKALKQIIADARSASGTTRFVDLLYPYILKSDNVCNTNAELPIIDPTDPANPIGYETWHGAKDVIDDLDTIHKSLATPDVLTLDLRDVFGDNPLPKLQLIRNYGYPHPANKGQDRIAQRALVLLKAN